MVPRSIFVVVFFLFEIGLIICQENYEINKTQLTDNLYKIEIGSVNLLAFIGEDGILLSDSGFDDSILQLDSLLGSISDEKVTTIINTHWHHDHCGGNIGFFKNTEIISHENTKGLLKNHIISKFWQQEYIALPEYALPNITFSDSLNIKFNNEEIKLIHLPNGHSNGDIIVYFEDSKIVHMGDLLFSFGFPAVDFENGGNVKQFACNLEKILNIMPNDITYIAGHGANFNKKQLIEYKNMIFETFYLISDSHNKGKKLKEAKYNKMLNAYKKWEEGYFSCNDWVEIVYASLDTKKTKTLK